VQPELYRDIVIATPISRPKSRYERSLARAFIRTVERRLRPDTGPSGADYVSCNYSEPKTALIASMAAVDCKLLQLW
jgi:hypothetical protein